MYLQLREEASILFLEQKVSCKVLDELHLGAQVGNTAVCVCVEGGRPVG